MDEIHNFIEEKNNALKINERNYTEEVHTLLDVKQNFTKVIDLSTENERILDLL